MITESAAASSLAFSRSLTVRYVHKSIVVNCVAEMARKYMHA